MAKESLIYDEMQRRKIKTEYEKEYERRQRAKEKAQAIKLLDREEKDSRGFGSRAANVINNTVPKKKYKKGYFF